MVVSAIASTPQVNNVINNQKHCKEHVMLLIFFMCFIRIKSGRGGGNQRPVIIK